MRTICAFANDFQNFGGGYIVVGVEERDGRPVLPPKGIERNAVDKLQKEVVRLCSFIKNTYTPIFGEATYDDKTLFIIWVPGGLDRPYSAPKTLGKNKEYQYYIRKGSSTVIAKNDELKELMTLTATIPFDDRPNRGATIEDIRLPLVLSFLKEIDSGLLEDARTLPIIKLCQQMSLVDGGNEALLPRNAALLFFNDQPQDFFPYAQIDVVFFPDGEGGDEIQEEIFQGPLDHQIKSALRHINNGFVTEKIRKIPGQAKAKRFFNYPIEAIEEALVNAVYHRSYEIREPIEVRINQDSIKILSYPGPDPSIPLEKLDSGRILSRRYRNRRIGEFLKELDFTEGRGTGVPKMQRALSNNGSPKAIFHSDEARSFFCTEILIHPEFAQEQEEKQSEEQVPNELKKNEVWFFTETELGILKVCDSGPLKMTEILTALGQTSRSGYIKKSMEKLLEYKLISQTLPDTPSSKNQRYQLTETGRDALLNHIS